MVGAGMLGPGDMPGGVNGCCASGCGAGAGAGSVAPAACSGGYHMPLDASHHPAAGGAGGGGVEDLSSGDTSLTSTHSCNRLRSAASTKFRNNMAIVVGPTPPTRGVM